MSSTRLLLAAAGIICASAGMSNAQGDSGRTAPHRVCAITISRTPGRSARSATASGEVLFRAHVTDLAGTPLEQAFVGIESMQRRVATNAHGDALLAIPARELTVADSAVRIVVRRLAYAARRDSVRAVPGDDFTVTAALCTTPHIMPMEIVSATHAVTPRGRIVGLVRDSASGRPVPRSWVMASVRAGSYRGLRSSEIDSTGAYRIDSVAGVVHVTVHCAMARGFSSRILAADSVTVADSDVRHRDWSVDATACDARPVRRVTGIFRGHYTGGFEADDFVPCAADAWFIPGDSLGGDPLHMHTTAVRLSPAARRTVRWPVDTASGPHPPRPYYVRWRGTVVGPGNYYVVGGSMFSLRVDSVLEVREPGPRDCSP